MEDIIRKKLTDALVPERLEVINESHLHAGHAGDNGSGQSHFKVLVVSKDLAALPKVLAQRQIYDVLSDELKNGIHALSIKVLAE